ncbi:jg12258 [Pararge aegeria aegeria]|uniref:Jg12258 protein n=1 Tax=Pararge aegeria aegeria TaxID=348720 RepID=A0A8S4S791_9NEOP|nr:jg12258 [Pararge aegeria aegeria]
MKLQNMYATIRKFYIDNNTFPTMIEKVALLLRTMTINIYGNNVKSISWFNYVTTIIAGACYFYVYMFSPWWLVFNRYSITENFIEMANAITLTTSGVTSLTKFIFMKFYISHIRETIEKILQFDVLITPGSRFAINLQNNLKVVKKRAFIVWIFLITNGTIYAVTPFLKPGRNFAEDPYILYGLEPMLKSPNYEIAHVVTTIAIFFCVHLMVLLSLTTRNLQSRKHCQLKINFEVRRGEGVGVGLGVGVKSGMELSVGADVGLAVVMCVVVDVRVGLSVMRVGACDSEHFKCLNKRAKVIPGQNSRRA